MADMSLLDHFRRSPDDDPDELVGHEQDPELEAVPPGEVPYPLPDADLESVPPGTVVTLDDAQDVV